MEIFNILKNKASRSILLFSAIKKKAKIWHFRELFNFYPVFDNYEIRTMANFENPNGKSLDLHLIWFMLKNCSRAQEVYSGHFQNTPNIKTFFGYAVKGVRKFRVTNFASWYTSVTWFSAKMTELSFLAYKGCFFFQQKYLKYVSRYAWGESFSAKIESIAYLYIFEKWNRFYKCIKNQQKLKIFSHFDTCTKIVVF